MKKIYLLTFIAVIFSSVLYGQGKVVKGKVSAKDGSPMPGVSVLLLGTTVATATNGNGEFEIEVPADELGKKPKLVFSFIGLKTVTLDYDTDLSNIVMEDDATELNEVVVTALNIERDKKALGYSVTEIKGDELVGSRETNVVQSLSSKVAGVQVIGSGGTPGASSKIIIRGNHSFTSENQPLFVIDGVPMNNQTESTVAGDYPFNENLQDVNYSNRAVDINPDDIEKITVLKGPSAAALYGVRAGNGVILITTKKTKLGQKPQVSFSSNVDLADVNKLPDLQTIYAQGTGGGFDGGNPVYNTYTPGANGIFQGGAGDDRAGTPNQWGPTNASLGISGRNNAKEFFKTGITYTNNLSVSAGNDRSSYRLSIGHTYQNGIIPNTNFERLSVRLNTQTDLAKNLNVSSMVNYIGSGGLRAQQGSNTSGVMLGLLRAPSSYNLADWGEYDNGQQKTYFANYDNPYWGAYNNTFKDNVDRLIANTSLNYTPFQWLKFTYRIGTDIYTDKRQGHFAIGANNSTQSKTGGEISENTQRYNELYQDILLTASTKILKDFAGSITIGNNINQRTNEGLYGRGRNLSIPKFYNMSNAADRYSDQTQSRIRSAAFFYDVNLNFKELLYIGTTGRLEYSSTFGPNKRVFFFPSLNASFVFSELDQLKSINNVLSFGKLRGSIARSANTPGAYSASTLFLAPFFTDGFTNGLSFPYNGVNGSGINNRLGNPNIQPEFTTGYEAGIELKFFKNRIFTDLTLYNQIHSNIILFRPIAGSSGSSQIIDNGGEMSNRGIELLLGVTPIKTESGFTWDISLNYTKNVNEVTKLANGIDQVEIETGFGDPGIFAIKGKPYGSIYGSKWEKAANGKLLIGDDGLPIVTTTTDYIANYYPLWTAGLRNVFSFKGVTLNVLWDFKQGGSIWNGTQGRLNRIGASLASADRERTFVVEGVKEDGSQNDIAVSALDYWQYVKGDFGATEALVQDASYQRLREASLSYIFPKVGFLKFFKTLEISVTGRNLILITNYTGVDPEQSLTGAGSNYNGVDWFAMPNTRSFNFGLKANF